MFQQVSFLLEHSDAEAASEGLLSRVHPQMRLQIPRHSELLSAILASIFTNGIVGVGVAGRAGVLVVVA